MLYVIIIIILTIGMTAAILWNAEVSHKKALSLTSNNGLLHLVSDQSVDMLSSLEEDTENAKELEENADRSERFHQLFECAPAGLMLADSEGLLLEANSTMLHMYRKNLDIEDAYRVNVVFPADAFRGKITPKEFVKPLSVCEISDDVSDMKLHYLEKNYIPIMGEDGKRELIYCEVRDASDYRNMLLDLSKAEKESQTAIVKIKEIERTLGDIFTDRGIYLNFTDFSNHTLTYYANPSKPVVSIRFDEMINYLKETGIKKQVVLTEEEMYRRFSEPYTATFKLRDIFSKEDDGELHEFTQRTIPVYDKKGRQTGCYGVIMDTTEISEKREKLRREHANAEHSAKQKSFFLASMTHEIRTPLNAIVGFTQILDSLETPEERKEILDIITQSCDVMLRLINDILIVSNTKDALAMSPTIEDFPTSFKKICDTLAQTVNMPGVEFIVDNPIKHLALPIDIGRVQQVVSNFVSNAVKYTTEGHIKVGYTYDVRRGLYVYCEDTGTGIPADERDEVFEQFVKLNEHVQGTGLGLNICKQIVEKCGGQIGVESELGKGSTFWFSIPQSYFNHALDQFGSHRSSSFDNFCKEITHDSTHVKFLVDQKVQVLASNYHSIYPGQPLSDKPLIGNILRCKNAVDSGQCGSIAACKHCALRNQINRTIQEKTSVKGLKAHFKYYLANKDISERDVDVNVDYQEVDAKPYAVLSFNDPWSPD